MLGRFCISLCLLCVTMPVLACGQDQSTPRVLILGDSVYRQPASEAAKELKGKAKVVFAPLKLGRVRNSETVLEDLDALLGEGDWDLILFNLGLGDLVYRVPGMKSFRLLPISAGGVRATSPEKYQENLDQLVTRLQATGARLVWSSTTPIRHSTSKVFAKGSEVEYNAIAARVMAKRNVPINDMYGYVLERIDMKRPASHGADPFFFDRKPLHPPIVASIRRELKLD